MRRMRTVLPVLALALVAALAAPASGATGRRVSMVAATGGATDTRPDHTVLTGPRPLHPVAYARAKMRADARAAEVTIGVSEAVAPLAAIGGTSWNGIYDPTVTPPDSTGAIGTNRYVEMVNLKYGIFDRSGAQIDVGSLATLTQHSISCLSDPQVMWDDAGQRFYYLAVDFCSNVFAFGFSKTDSPLDGSDASWCKYTADFGYGSYLPDYPKLGDSRDFVMIGTNTFLLGLVYTGSEVDWISKPAAAPITGACPDGSTYRLGYFPDLRAPDGTQVSTPVPANGVDASDFGYVVATLDPSAEPGGTADSIYLFSVTKDASGDAVTGSPTQITVNPYGVPASAPQKGTAKKLDTLDSRLRQAVAAYDPTLGGIGVWTSHAVFGGAGSQERWYEIDATTGKLARSGRVSAASLYVFNGAVSPDRAVLNGVGSFGGSMVFGFNTSSGSTFSAIQMVSRPVGGPQSGMTLVKSSGGKNVDPSCTPVCRWGDYSGASPDPLGGASSGVVWLSNQWNRRSPSGQDVDWRTWNWAAVP